MDKKQNSLIANIEIDKLDITSGWFSPPIEDPNINGALWNDVGVLKISGAIEPGVRIRYTSTDDLTLLTPYAVGGTAYITDNSDGTYDLWSDDNCEFIALSDNYYNHNTLNITKSEVINGNTLKYVFYNTGKDFALTFGEMPNLVEFTNSHILTLTSTKSMLEDCNSLTNINFNNFDTTNITDMESMFHSCSSLVFVDVSNFDTSNVNDMNYMFYGCESLINIDVSNFDTSNVNDMNYMYSGCESLINIDVSNFDTSNVVNTYYMYSGCLLLESIYMTSWTPITGDATCMFRDCSALVCITNLDTTNSTNKTDMFLNCTSLIQPDATAQTDLIDNDGADWVNPGSCP